MGHVWLPREYMSMPFESALYEYFGLMLIYPLDDNMCDGRITVCRTMKQILACIRSYRDQLYIFYVCYAIFYIEYTLLLPYHTVSVKREQFCLQ